MLAYQLGKFTSYSRSQKCSRLKRGTAQLGIDGLTTCITARKTSSQKKQRIDKGTAVSAERQPRADRRARAIVFNKSIRAQRP